MRIDLTIDRSSINPGQWEMLNTRASEWPVSLFSGGYGAGKTTCLALMLLVLKAQNPRAPGLIIAQDFRSLWSTVMMTIRRVLAQSLPPNWQPVIRDKQGACYLDFGDGVPIFLRSANNWQSYDGLDVGWALGDEARYWTYRAYEVALGRIRVPCPNPLFALFSTPEMNWLGDEFNTGKNSRRLVIAPTIENLRNLRPDFLDNLKVSYSERMQAAVIHGIFTILEGAVYESLAADPFAADSDWAVDYSYDRSRETFLAVDPGYRRSSWVFLQRMRKHEWVAFDELMLDNTSDAEAVQLVNAKGYSIDQVWTDPAADATQSAFNIDTIDMLKGIRTRSPEPIRYISGPFRGIPYGVERMRMLIGNPKAGQPIRLKFARALRQIEAGQSRGVVKDLLAYRYPPIKDGRELKNQPLKDGKTDHTNDALRYWGVGMYLTTGLRDLDHATRLMAKDSQGFKIAA